jgi:hypothetical protein
MNWSAGNIDVFDDTVQITNSNKFNVTGQLALVNMVSPFVTGRPLFSNSGILTQDGAGSALNIQINFDNTGTVLVKQGVLTLLGDGTHTGVFEAEAGTEVHFSRGTQTFKPIAIFSPHLLRGDGRYIVDVAGTLDVPGSFQLQADFFELTRGGTLKGLGTFEAAIFNWTGGTMSGDANQLGLGTTLLESSDTMYITPPAGGNPPVFLQQRQILNHGQIFWTGTGGTIEVSAQGAIINDGGKFFIQSDGLIKDSGGAGNLVVSNGGLIDETTVVIVNTTTIQLNVQNNGGTFTTNFDLTLTKDYTQTAGSTNLDLGNVSVQGRFSQSGGQTSVGGGASLSGQDLLTVTGGLLTLNGGTIDRKEVQIQGTAQFIGGGDILRDFSNDSLTNFIGTVNIGGVFKQGQNSATAVTRFGTGTVTVAGGTVRNDGGTMILEGGTLVISRPSTELFIGQGAVLQGSGKIVSAVVNAGTITIGDANTIGKITITESYSQMATGTLNIKIGGDGIGQYDQLILGTNPGTFSLSGTLNVTLMPGFTPTNTTKRLKIIQSNARVLARTGTFTTVNAPPNLPGNLKMKVEYNAMDVTLHFV